MKIVTEKANVDDSKLSDAYHTIDSLFGEASLGQGEVAPGMPMLAPTPLPKHATTLLPVNKAKKRATRVLVAQTAAPQSIRISQVAVGQPQRAQIVTVGTAPQRATVSRAKPQLPERDEVHAAFPPAADSPAGHDAATVDAADTTATDDDDDDDESSTDSLGDDNPDITTVVYVTVGKTVRSVHLSYFF